MTSVGDRVSVVMGADGKYYCKSSPSISVGDRVQAFIGSDGKWYASKSGTPSVGSRVLASLDSTGKWIAHISSSLYERNLRFVALYDSNHVQQFDRNYVESYTGVVSNEIIFGGTDFWCTFDTDFYFRKYNNDNELIEEIYLSEAYDDITSGYWEPVECKRYDYGGNYVGSSYAPTTRSPGRAVGVAVDSKDNIWVTAGNIYPSYPTVGAGDVPEDFYYMYPPGQNNATIYKFDKYGNFLLKIRTEPTTVRVQFNGFLSAPTVGTQPGVFSFGKETNMSAGGGYIAVDSQDNIYVTSGMIHFKGGRLYKFSSSGENLGVVYYGSLDNSGEIASGVTVDINDTVYVIYMKPYETQQILKYDATLTQIGSFYTGMPYHDFFFNNNVYPGIAVSPTLNIWTYGFRGYPEPVITQFSPSGEAIQRIGTYINPIVVSGLCLVNTTDSNW